MLCEQFANKIAFREHQYNLSAIIDSLILFANPIIFVRKSFFGILFSNISNTSKLSDETLNYPFTTTQRPPLSGPSWRIKPLVCRTLRSRRIVLASTLKCVASCINRSMPTHSYRLRMSAWMYHYRCISHRLSRFMSQKTEYIRSKGQNCAKKRSISVHMHMGFVRLGRKRAEIGAFPSTCVSISVYPSDIYVRETVHFRSPFQDFSARSISVHWPRLRTVPSSHEKRSISVHFSLVLPTFASKLKNNKMQSSHGR